MTWVVLMSELALGLGITLGFLTPIALFASIALNLLYLVLMIHDWAEQGQNLMMILIAVVALGLHSWQVWSWTTPSACSTGTARQAGRRPVRPGA